MHIIISPQQHTARRSHCTSHTHHTRNMTRDNIRCTSGGYVYVAVLCAGIALLYAPAVRKGVDCVLHEARVSLCTNALYIVYTYISNSTPRTRSTWSSTRAVHVFRCAPPLHHKSCLHARALAHCVQNVSAILRTMHTPGAWKVSDVRVP